MPLRLPATTAWAFVASVLTRVMCCLPSLSRRRWAERVKAQVAAAADMEAADEADRVSGQRDYYLALKAQQRAAKLAYVATSCPLHTRTLPNFVSCAHVVFDWCLDAVGMRRRRAQQEEYTNKIDNRYFDKFNQTSHN